MNAKTSGFKLTTNTARPPVDPAALAAFALAAEVRTEGEGAALVVPAVAASTPAKTEPAPEAAKVDFDAIDHKRRRPTFSMRLTDREQAMLKEISETTRHSMHEFVLMAMHEALEKHFGKPM